MAKLHTLDKLTLDNGTRRPVQRAVQFCDGGLSVLDGEVTIRFGWRTSNTVLGKLTITLGLRAN
jgi:hypothetical protein